MALLLCPAAALAEPASSDVELARGAFKQAELAFANAHYEDALALFRLAFSKVPNDAVRFNVGVCLERLGRPAEARSEYEAAAASVTLGAEQRAAARERADSLAPRTAELVLNGAAAGAQVSVDGRAVCTTPCRVFVEPGGRQVTLKTAEELLSVEVVATAGVASAVTFPERRAVPPPAAPQVAPSPAPSTAQSRSVQRDGFSPGWLSVVGGVTAGVGAAGVVGWGLRTRSLESSYHAAPSVDVREEGLRMQALTNVSIGVASLGAALVVLDLLVLDTGQSSSTLRAGGDHLRWSF